MCETCRSKTIKLFCFCHSEVVPWGSRIDAAKCLVGDGDKRTFPSWPSFSNDGNSANDHWQECHAQRRQFPLEEHSFLWIRKTTRLSSSQNNNLSRTNSMNLSTSRNVSISSRRYSPNAPPAKSASGFVLYQNDSSFRDGNKVETSHNTCPISPKGITGIAISEEDIQSYRAARHRNGVLTVASYYQAPVTAPPPRRVPVPLLHTGTPPRFSHCCYGQREPTRCCDLPFLQDQ